MHTPCDDHFKSRFSPFSGIVLNATAKTAFWVAAPIFEWEKHAMPAGGARFATLHITTKRTRAIESSRASDSEFGPHSSAVKRPCVEPELVQATTARDLCQGKLQTIRRCGSFSTLQADCATSDRLWIRAALSRLRFQPAECFISRATGEGGWP